MSLQSAKAHLPQCIENTVMFDCEGNPTERVEVIIDTIAEYYGYKGVIFFLNSPIEDYKSGWEGFYPRLLFSAYETILSSYVEALTSGDKKTDYSDIDWSMYNLSREGGKYDMDFHKKAYHNIDRSIHAICGIENKYDIDYLDPIRFSLLARLYEEESCKTLLNEYFSQLSDDSKYKFCRALGFAIDGIESNFRIKKFTAE